MSKIYLVRHGETEWNAAGLYQGALDSQLTRRGLNQARRVGEVLARHADQIDAAFVSPLGRVRQTHAVLAPYLGSVPTAFDERRREVSFGSWDGLSLAEIEAEWPDALTGSTRFDWYFRSPDGESYEAAAERARNWLAGADGTVVAVAHGLIGRLLRGAYLGLPRDEALSLPLPQDIVWLLEDGDVSALACGAE